jgi:hypothetical protein
MESKSMGRCGDGHIDGRIIGINPCSESWMMLHYKKAKYSLRSSTSTIVAAAASN